MPSLQASSCRTFHRPPMFSSFWGKDLCSSYSGAIGMLGARKEKLRFNGGTVRLTVIAMSSGSSSSLKMNLNEYMVTLEKPLGIRFALSVDGKVFVHSLKRGSNAEKSRIIMVGDTLKKASDSSGGRLMEIKDFGDTQ